MRETICKRKQFVILGCLGVAILLTMIVIINQFLSGSSSKVSKEEAELKTGTIYSIKDFKVTDKKKQLVEVTFNNDGVDTTIVVSYIIDYDRYYTLQKDNTILGERVLQYNWPNYIRFSEDIDYEIRVALNN